MSWHPSLMTPCLCPAVSRRQGVILSTIAYALALRNKELYISTPFSNITLKLRKYCLLHLNLIFVKLPNYYLQIMVSNLVYDYFIRPEINLSINL